MEYKISERIEKARLYSGLSQDKLGKEIGKSRKTIINYESNASEPSVTIVQKIAQLTKVDEWWLLTGKGEMLQNNSVESTLVVKDNNLVEFPYFEETYASAGGGVINYEEAKKPIAFDKTFLEKTLGIKVFKNLHIINSTGNSMEPTIKEKSLLFVNPFENESCIIKDGGIYVIMSNNSTFVKRISKNPITGAMTLKSDNPTYEDIQINGQEFEACTIIGRVVGHFSSF